MAAAARPRRKDPAPRPVVDGGGRHTRLVGTDPNRHYICVNRASNQGVEYFESLGYQTETHREGGVKFRNGAKTGREGEEVRFRELVVMSISREDKERLDRYGPTGDSGTALRDRREKELLSRKSRMMDPFEGRGFNRNHFGYENETTEGQPVV